MTCKAKGKVVGPPLAGDVIDPIDLNKNVANVTEDILPTTEHVFHSNLSGDILKGAFNTKTGIAIKQFWTGPPRNQRFAMIK